MEEPVKTKLVKTSICPCGHNLLNDSIQIGTEYLVYPRTANPEDPFTLICGGCHERSVGLGRIYAGSVLNPSAQPTPLPLELFAIAEDYA